MPQEDHSRPLESLLLFQTIANYGIYADNIFDKAASFLRHSNLFENAQDSQFDPIRLQELFIALLKQRVKQDLVLALDKDTSSNNPASTPQRSKRDLSPNKKRVTSPRIATLEDARKHEYLIPKMLPDLYANYREQIVRDIKADEERYSALLKELQDAPEAEPKSPRSPKRVAPSTISKAGQAGRSHDANASANDVLTPNSLASKHRPIPESNSHTQTSHSTAASEKLETTITVSNGSNDSDDAIRKASPPSRISSKQSSDPNTGSSASPSDAAATAPLNDPRTIRQRESSQYPNVAHSHPNSPQTNLPTSAQSRAIQQSHSTASHLQPQSRNPTSTSPAARPSPSLPKTARPHAAGTLLQPFQVNPQAPRNSTPASQRQSPATQSRAAPRNLSDTAHRSGLVAPQTPLHLPPHLGLAPANSLPRLHPPANGILSPGSSTVWKRSHTHTAPRSHVARAFSPLSDDDTADAHQQTPVQATRANRKTKNTLAPSTSRSALGRGIKPSASKTPSVAGASFSARTRSQSISSYAEGASVATPNIDSDHEAGSPSRSSRRLKRQRTDSYAPPPPLSSSGPPVRSDTVLAWRNFNRMSQALMDNITSHRHGTRFQTSVAKSSTKLEGYEDIIKQPQDLKSIKQAISAGARAVTAAIAAAEAAVENGDEPVGVIHGSGSSITLPASEDFMPPKAIVNADQLEQELMRMFANAFLFNQGTGPEGVPGEAVDMFNDVTKYLDQWRASDVGDEAGAKSAVKRDRERESIGGKGDDDTGGGRKRRRHG